MSKILRVLALLLVIISLGGCQSTRGSTGYTDATANWIECDRHLQRWRSSGSDC